MIIHSPLGKFRGEILFDIMHKIIVRYLIKFII